MRKHPLAAAIFLSVFALFAAPLSWAQGGASAQSVDAAATAASSPSVDSTGVQWCTYSAQQHAYFKVARTQKQYSGYTPPPFHAVVYSSAAGNEVTCTDVTPERLAPSSRWTDKQDRGLVVRMLRAAE